MLIFFSQMNGFKYQQGLSFHLPLCNKSMQSREGAISGVSRLRSLVFHFVKTMDVFKVPHALWPSMSRSLPPVQAVHVNIILPEQTSEIKHIVAYLFVLVFFLQIYQQFIFTWTYTIVKLRNRYINTLYC